MQIKVEYPVTTIEVKEVEISDEYAKYLEDASYIDSYNELCLDFTEIPTKIMKDIDKCVWEQTRWDKYSDEYEILNWETNTKKESE